LLKWQTLLLYWHSLLKDKALLLQELLHLVHLLLAKLLWKLTASLLRDLLVNELLH